MGFFTRFKPSRVKGLACKAPSMVQPQFKESCDIGSMIRRAVMGDPSVFGHPRYINALGSPDSFADAALLLARAETLWNDLPDKVRASYGTPAALLADYERVVKSRNFDNQKVTAPNQKVTPVDSGAVSSDETAHADNT